jgi:type II secretory pathway pseudopilin PulG
MRRSRVLGFSLVEVAIILTLTCLLLAIGATSYFRYRANTAVNTAAETVEALLMRAREEAKSSGFALDPSLRQEGVAAVAPAGRHGAEGALAVRVRKRYRAGTPAQLVATKDLSLAAPVEIEVSGLGTVDLDTDTGLEGVFFEVLLKKEGLLTVLAAIPVDVNGEFILAGTRANASIRLNSGSYDRTVELTTRGVIAPDRR